MKQSPAKTGTSSSRERAENIGFRRSYDCVFRLNAGGVTGLGHLRRSLVLAQALKKRGIKSIAFATRNPEIIKNFISPAFSLIPIPKNQNEFDFWTGFTKNHGVPAITVVDCYAVSYPVLKKLRGLLPFLVFVDDFKHLPEYPVDVLINPNVHGKSLRYRALPHTRCLQGPDFALIDPFFLNAPLPHHRSKRLRCYAALGGSPSRQILSKLIRVFSSLRPSLQVDIAAGLTHNPAHRPQGSSIRFLRHDEARQAMKKCDFALSASGVTSSELAAMGKPALLVILAKNQEAISRSMDRLGMAKSLGWFLKLKDEKIAEAIRKFMASPRLREALSKESRKMIDGKGADRLSKAILRAAKEKQ